MSKRSTILISMLMALFLALGCLTAVGNVSVPKVSAESASGEIVNSDFFQQGTGVSGAPAQESTKTEVTLPYSAENGHVFFGKDAETPYLVNMAVFSWNVKIDQIAVGQAFAISFLKDTSHKPFDGQAVGVSFVFECVGEGVLLEYIVDAKDGTIIQEMVDTPSMWAYKTDGTFEEYPKTDGEESYSRGMVGRLSNGSIAGSALTLMNTVDSASFGGTTNRPSVSGGNSLGTTIPGEIFKNRGMETDKTVLVLSAGGIDGIGEVTTDLKFTVDTPADKATKAYLAGADRMSIVNRLTDYTYDAQEALEGTLSQEDYNAMIADLTTMDFGALRERDRYNQQKIKETVEATLEELNVKMLNVPNAVSNYSDALKALSSLSGVTQEKIDAAQAAREVYVEYAAYVKYLSGSALEEAQRLVDALDETLLARAELHMQISAYESEIAKFADPVFDTAPAAIYAAEVARGGIDFAALEQMSAEDKKAFEDRIAACDEKVEEARVLNAYDVENYKITLYKNAAEALAGVTDVDKFLETLATRPQLKLNDILSDDAAKLETALKAVDQTYGGHVVRVLGIWADAYGEKTFALEDLASLTEAKIAAAKAAAYNGKMLASMKAIAGEIGYDISAVVSELEECDRVVEAAQIRLLLVRFNQLAGGQIASVQEMDEAYEAYVVASESDLAILSASERSAYDAMLASAVENYEAAVQALIDPLIEAFENAVADADIHTGDKISAAKEARSAIPDLKYYIVAQDRGSAETRYNAANDILLSQALYYAVSGGSSWTVSESEQGLRLDNKLTDNNNCEGLAIITDPLDIDGFDFAFDFTEIGRIWKGEDPVGSGKYPQSIYVMNIMRDAGKNKDQSQGFSIYFFCNHLDELEVNIYGAASASGEVLLAQGKIGNAPFTADPYVPYTVRIRIEVGSNNYRIFVNSLQLNVYFRDIINPDTDRASHLPEFEVGAEIGGNIFKDGKAYVTFVVFADSLTAEERESAITIRMIGDKTFGGYVPPVYTVSVDLVSGPNKTVYQKGEEFDKTGIQMKATLSDGNVIDIPTDKIRVLGFTSTSKGTKKVTLSYTDDTGVTLNKVIEVEIVDAETEPEESKGGCGGSTSAACIGAAVLLLSAGALLLTRKAKKS